MMMIIDNWQFISSTTSIISSFSFHSLWTVWCIDHSRHRFRKGIDSSLYRSSRRDSQLLSLFKSKFIFALFFFSSSSKYIHICTNVLTCPRIINVLYISIYTNRQKSNRSTSTKWNEICERSKRRRNDREKYRNVLVYSHRFRTNRIHSSWLMIYGRFDFIRVT